MSSLEQIRHSYAHLLAAAIEKMYPGAKNTIGPAIDNGFYYDFEFAEGKIPSEKEFLKIESTMRKILPHWKGFEKIVVTADEARAKFAGNPYKLELIEDIAKKGEEITLYKSGDFTDLCRGGHADIKEMKEDAFKIERIAGAYWRGDEKNKMLTRIYGLAFNTKEELEAYVHQQEEAKKRDHKKLGRDMKLFTISPLVGAGLPLMQPKGMIIRKTIEDYLWSLHADKGYDRVWTPHIAHEELYVISGHAAKFGDELFRVKGKEDNFILKPMNCPHHMQIFADNQWSYKELPVRYFEPATVYRDEKSGQLGGLTRVRSITQDDGHLFCRKSQINEEVSTIVGIIKEFYTTIGLMKDYWVRLSIRGEDKSQYLGGDDVWNTAEAALEKAAKENNLNYKPGPGEAAFYGPKLDFMFKDAIGREWQLATIQCDFNLPERFNLEFTNEKGEKERPVVIHRAISGSLERFLGILIEHFTGAFPLWLSPVQVSVIPVRDTHNAKALEVSALLKAAGLRVDIDISDTGFGKKIREAKNQKVPYSAIIGDQDIEKGVVTLESRDKGKIGEMKAEEVVKMLKEEAESKK